MSPLRSGWGRTREPGVRWAARQRPAGRVAGEVERRRLPPVVLRAGGRGSGAAAGAGAAEGGN
eukprot:2735112-Pleurochrysis_carterae.AAC.1